MSHFKFYSAVNNCDKDKLSKSSPTRAPPEYAMNIMFSLLNKKSRQSFKGWTLPAKRKLLSHGMNGVFKAFPRYIEKYHCNT